jgi:hypothetical protein
MTNVVGVVIDLKQGNVSTSNRNAIVFATPSWLYVDYNFYNLDQCSHLFELFLSVQQLISPNKKALI